MKLDIESTEKLLDYVKSNEVVYQTYGGLIEVANDSNIDNRSELIDFINRANCVEVYHKDDTFIQEPFEDLNNWATKDDVFFFTTDCRSSFMYSPTTRYGECDPVRFDIL